MQVGCKAIFLVLTGCLNATALANEVLVSEPASFPAFMDCDEAIATGIQGTWGVDAALTFRDSDQRDNVAILTITGATMVMDIPNVGQIERSYRLIGNSDQYFTLELTDNTGATETLNVQSTGCTLIYPSQQDCHSEYCENIRAEIYQRISENIGGALTGVQIRERAESPEAIARQHAKQTPKQFYYQRVAKERLPERADVQ